MKRYIVCMVWAVIAAVLLVAGFPSIGVAAPVTVQVCGISAGNDEGKAMADARQKAVKRILSQILSPSDAPDSLYQQILSQYACYSRDGKVVQKTCRDGQLYVIESVQVDADAMAAAVKTHIAGQQQAADEEKLCFAARIRGLAPQETRKAEQGLANIYGTTFQNLGFASKRSDELMLAAARETAATPQQFMDDMVAMARDDIEITTAVIGDIDIQTMAEDEASTTLHANVRMRAISLLHDRETVVADFSESYDMKQSSREKALEMLIYKIGMDTSRDLADRTLSYWNKQH